MGSKVVQAEDTHAIGTILSNDSEVCQHRFRFYNSLDLTPAEFIELETLTSSYEFFCRTLCKWRCQFGEAATFKLLESKLKQELFAAAAQKISRHANARAQETSSSQPKKNIWFEVPEDVRNFTGRVAELEWIHEAVTKSKQSKRMTVITTLSGLGGIGKTSLTIRYAWEHRDFFQNNIIWINAENNDSLRGSFERLAKFMNIETGNFRHLDVTELIKSVYTFLKGMEILMIFDNVESEEDIEPNLPSITHPDQKIPAVLLTSRNREWSDCALCCEVGVFTEKDCLDFLTDYLSLKCKNELDMANQLSETLQRLPIAVRQAAAYIKQFREKRKISNVDSIRQYLVEFEKCSKSVLNFDYCKKTKDKFNKLHL